MTEIHGEPGQHTVTEEPVISGERIGLKLDGIDLDKNIDDIDWGQPMSPENFKDLQEFVDQYLQNLLKTLNVAQFLHEKDLFDALAEQIRFDFPFIEQGTGIATTSKQLETYKALHGDKQALAEKSDCKLPTVIFSMVCERLKEMLKISEVKILVVRGGSHPHILVRTQTGKSYLVDYRLKKRPNEFERSRESIVDIRELDENKDFDKKVLERTLGINVSLALSVEDLKILDQNFLNS